MLKSLRNKIAIGSAQFGMDYGIANTRGRVPPIEVNKILKLAYRSGIDTIDTAPAYGESEKTLGKCLAASQFPFRLISKSPPINAEQIIDSCQQSLRNLNISHLAGYLVHDFSYFQNHQSCWKVFQKLKKRKLVEKIGFSLYLPEELAWLIDNDISFDLLQVPYNIFDQRFAPWFSVMKKKKVEIHVRSPFLQGLIFKTSASLNPFFNEIKPKLTQLQQLSLKHKIPLSAIGLLFSLLHPQVDRVIMGLDSVSNLKENLHTISYQRQVEQLMPTLLTFAESNLNMILPTLWPKL